MSEAGESEVLDNLIAQFAAAEESLRAVLDAAKDLTTAREGVEAARSDFLRGQEEGLNRLEEARQRIREDFSLAEANTSARLEGTVRAVEARLDALEEGFSARCDVSIEKLAAASSSLETSQRSLADVASGVWGLTAEVKDIARDLKDVAIAFRALQPERIDEHLGTLSDGLKGLDDDISGVEARQRNQQMLLVILLVAVVIMGLVGALL